MNKNKYKLKGILSYLLLYFMLYGVNELGNFNISKSALCFGAGVGAIFFVVDVMEKNNK